MHQNKESVFLLDFILQTLILNDYKGYFMVRLLPEEIRDVQILFTNKF